MKTTITTLLCCFIISIASFAQNKSENKTETFKVFGNCNMCKANIESVLKKKDGVLSKNWNKDTKILTITYDPVKISVQQIAQKVADKGYDNEFATAKPDSYNKLDKCCQYDRKKDSK